MRFYLRNFRLTKRLPERINFVSRGSTVFVFCIAQSNKPVLTQLEIEKKNNTGERRLRSDGIVFVSAATLAILDKRFYYENRKKKENRKRQIKTQLEV